MLKKMLVLFVVVALLAGIMVLPASAATVVKEWTFDDFETYWTDGVYQYMQIDFPLEAFQINVIQNNNSTSIGKGTGEITLTLSENSKYSIVFSLKSSYPISLDGFPDDIEYYVDWNISSTGSYDTPTTHTFIDYYSGANGAGSKTSFVGQDFKDLDLDGTGKYAIEPLDYTDWISRDTYGYGANAFCFGLSFRKLQPLTSGTYTFKINSVTIVMYMPVSVSLQSQIDELDAEVETMPEKFGDEMQGVLDTEKEEASNAGDSAAVELMDMIPNESQGFMDAVQSLVSSMSYSGTDAKLPVPAITIPAIPGVMDAIQLTDELYVDFGYWVQQLPSGVLKLVQILCTIALIVYCFKELYGMIAYAMTLKGGGSSE